MYTKSLTSRFALFIAGVLCLIAVGAATGCAMPSLGTNSADAAREENRSYMAKVNQTMDDLTTGLTSFNEAVSKNDLVGMKTQAERAYKSLDELNKLEVPDAMKDIQSEYVSGVNDLKDALNARIDLSTKIDTSNEKEPFDYTKYGDELAKISDTYQKGIAHLENGDKKATEKA